MTASWQYPTPRKRFGQHFLHDPRLIDALIAALQLEADQRVIEIGPGRGALTVPLLDKLHYLIVIELDRDLIAPLQRFDPDGQRLEIHQADALKVDFAAFRIDQRPLRIIGNLPYNISTPLLFHLLTFTAHIADLHLMLQKEVVDRLAAAPDTDAYGRLSVMVQYHCRVEPLMRIRAGSFRPRPQVESGFVRLIPHPQAPVAVTDFDRFAAIVRAAFGQRRKTLRNALRFWCNESHIEACGIDPMARPETLSLAQFAALSEIAK